jgi:hypothetical protein
LTPRAQYVTQCITQGFTGKNPFANFVNTGTGVSPWRKRIRATVKATVKGWAAPSQLFISSPPH